MSGPSSVLSGSHLSSTNGTPRVMGMNKRRGKVSLACSPCRKAKKKCDGCCPCSTCLCLKKPEACIFNHNSDRRRRNTLKKTLEKVQQEKKRLQDIFNYLRDSDAKSTALLLTQIREGLTMDELTKHITQKEDVNTRPGAFGQTQVVTTPLPLESPILNEAFTASISSREDWELPLRVEDTSIKDLSDTTRTFPSGLEGSDLMHSDGTEAIDNTKRVRRRVSILWAAAYGDEAFLVFLLREHENYLAFTNAYSQTPLSLAAENGHEGVVRQLLKRNDIGINCSDLDGQTALAWAAFNGHSVVVQLLLERDDLDANSKDIDGNTPLSWAATNGYDRVVALLLERYDVATSPVNNFGRTPLSLASANGHECIIKRLILWDDGPHLVEFEH